MHSVSRKIISLVMCLFCTAALAACRENGIFINNDENGNVYTLSHDITFSSAMLRSINPVTSPDNDFYHISKLVYDSLVELDDTLAPQPCLASGWTIDAGELTAEFTLRSGVKFSDGSELTAQDVVFSFNACKSSGTSPYRSALSAVSKAEAADSSTVRFRLSSSSDISASDFVFPVVSSGQFSSQKEFLAASETIAVGTGRYMIASADIRKEIRLEANPYYNGTKPSNNITVDISPVETPYTGFAETGKLSIIIQTDADRDDVSGNDRLKVTEFTSNEFEALGFNCSSGPCADPALRRAVAYIADRDEIKRAAYYNNGIKSDDLYYPGYYGTEIKNTYTPDKDKAEEQLKKAGYTDSDGDGMLENPEGNTLRLTLGVSLGNTSRLTAAQLIASELLDSGISVDIKEIPSSSFISSVSSGSCDMFIGGWKAAGQYDLRNFYHSSYSNPAGYSDSELDGLLDSLRSGPDNEEAVKILKKIKEILNRDVPYLCLLYRTYAAVTTVDLEGLVAPRFNNYYFACDDWSIRVYRDRDDEDTRQES